MRIAYLDILAGEAQDRVRKVGITAAVSGISQAGILAVINSASLGATEDGVNFRLFLLFMLMMAVYVYTRHFALFQARKLAENTVGILRNRIVDRLRKSSLRQFEGMSRSDVQTVLSRECQTISNNMPIIINGCSSGILLFAAAVYIAVISMSALVMTAVILAAGMLYFVNAHKDLQIMMRESNTTENSFFHILTHLLEGFKEVKMHHPRSDALYHNHMTEMVHETTRTRNRLGGLISHIMVFSQASFYMLIASVIFVLPSLTSITDDTVTKLTAIILFLIGPVSDVVGMIPTHAEANVAANTLHEMEERLVPDEDLTADSPSYRKMAEVSEITSLTCTDVMFSYLDHNGTALFTLGPVTADIGGKELIYVVGGNGSGKSTFLKVIARLYPQQSGTICLNGIPLDTHNCTVYRNNFSAIFCDFHLFDRLYGMEDVDADHVNSLLKKVRLDKKVYYDGEKFNTLDLSTGQRKRMAFVVALLEDRPIYLLDELAADQDPEFREYYYQELLPELREQGKTLIVVTHDDRYLHTGDRILQMDFGHMEEIEVKE